MEVPAAERAPSFPGSQPEIIAFKPPDGAVERLPEPPHLRPAGDGSERLEVAQHVAYHQGEARFFDRGNHLAAVRQVERHGLFQEDVLSRLCGFEHALTV